MKLGFMRLQALMRSRQLTHRFSNLRTRMTTLQVIADAMNYVNDLGPGMVYEIYKYESFN